MNEDHTQDLPVCDDELVEFDVPTEFGPLPAPVTAEELAEEASSMPNPRPSRYVGGPAWPPSSACSRARWRRRTSPAPWTRGPRWTGPSAP